MLHILYGADDFTSKELLNRIKTGCEAGEMGDVNTTVLDGGKLTVNELLTACNTISFFSQKRLVIVNGLLTRFEKHQKRGKGKKGTSELKEWDTLAGLGLPKSTVLVLVDKNLSKTNLLLKMLAPAAEVVECKPIDLKSGELPNWIVSRVKANKGEISPKAVRLLVDLIGNDLWILSNEVDKLCIHAGEKRIEEADIGLLVSNAREANVFHMVDAVVQRRRDVAWRLLHQLMDEGAAPPYLLHMIISEFRLMIQVKQQSGQGLSARAIGNNIGESKDWKVEKLMRYTGRYSLSKLEDIYRQLLETDVSIKTGKREGELALDLLITDLCN